MAAISPPTSKIADTSDAGHNCPYCRFAFKPGIELVVCGVCAAHHHQDCWADNGGCAVLGCAAAPVAGQSAAAAPTVAAAAPRTPAPDAAPPVVAPAASRLRSRQPLLFGLAGLVVVAAIVVATLAVSGAFDKQSDTARTPSPATTGETSPPPPPPPPPSASSDPTTVLATVVGTCGDRPGSGDCRLSLRDGPGGGYAEVDVLRNGEKVRVVCQRAGERAYSSKRRAASNVWARTEDGLYGANIYLRGDGLNAFEVTRPCR